MQKTPHRAEVLQQALDATLKSRNASYGDPYPNMTLAAKFMELYREAAAGKYDLAHDASIALVLMKIARIATGATGHTDNYVDGAAYMAIAAECQLHGTVSSQNQSAVISKAELAELFRSDRPLSPQKVEGLIVEDPINIDTALFKVISQTPEVAYSAVLEIGMLFKTQDSGVAIWEVTGLLPDDEKGMKWFKAARFNRPAASRNPSDFMERMPASAIYHVVLA